MQASFSIEDRMMVFRIPAPDVTKAQWGACVAEGRKVAEDLLAASASEKLVQSARDAYREWREAVDRLASIRKQLAELRKPDSGFDALLEFNEQKDILSLRVKTGEELEVAKGLKYRQKLADLSHDVSGKLPQVSPPENQEVVDLLGQIAKAASEKAPQLVRYAGIAEGLYQRKPFLDGSSVAESLAAR